MLTPGGGGKRYITREVFNAVITDFSQDPLDSP
jgi:hypothetical protein